MVVEGQRSTGRRRSEVTGRSSSISKRADNPMLGLGSVTLSRFLSSLKRKACGSRWPSSASFSSSSSSVGVRRSSTNEDGRPMSSSDTPPPPPPPPPPPAAAAVRAVSTPDFYNTQVIYGSRNSWSILRSYFVFSLCSVDFIVDHQTKILSWMRRMLGRQLFLRLMKKTIFGQFMSSDDPTVILDLARSHSQSRLIPLFAYTAAEFHGRHTTGELPAETSAAAQEERSARDVWCRRNFDAILRGISIASQCKEFTLDKPVITTKVTFLTDYTVLRNLTKAINQQTKLIKSAMIDRCQMKDRSRNRRLLIEYLSKDVFQNLRHVVDLSQLATPGQVTSNAKASLSPGDGDQLSGLLTSVRFHLAFNQSLHEEPSTAAAATATMLNERNRSTVIKLRREDVVRIIDVWSSMTELNQRAKEEDVLINYDAEQTFIQPAIEALVLDSMRLFNRHQPLVLNTYQCYLKRTFDVLKRDLDICDSEGFCFGGKVVRGAYMDEERRLARETNLSDPVNDSYESTTDVYNKAIDHLLSRSVDRPTTQPLGRQMQRIIVATHNVDTVNGVIKQLKERKLDARNIGLSFAQLLGTRDYISFALGAAGYPAGKLIHYADPEDGLAYLSRRLQENRSGLPSPAIERRLLLLELKRRILRR